jgi:hypothetical protein
MLRDVKSLAYLSSALAPVLFGGISLTTSAVAAPCGGPGAPKTTQTKCVTDADSRKSAEFIRHQLGQSGARRYLGDRSNSGVDVFDTHTLKFKRTIGGFAGIVLKGTAVDNNHSGPDGVTSHGRWLYAGDGNSTLHVIDLDSPTASATKAIISTGGTTRLDEMALTTDGKRLLGANNAEDPPFATLFSANGDAPTNSMGPGSILGKVTVDPTVLPTGFGLSLEQPAWDPTTKRFLVSIPIIANNPAGCNYGQLSGPITCSGGMAVIDPDLVSGPTVIGAFDALANTGVVPLPSCGPNGAAVGAGDNVLLGCTPGNFPPGTTTLVINATTKNSASVNGITGSDEVYYNAGDNRYYLGASKAIKPAGSPLGSGAVLGVVDGSSVLVEAIPQSSGSHSVAADSSRNLIFVPQVWTHPGGIGSDTNTTAGTGSPTVGSLICGSLSGCIAGTGMTSTMMTKVATIIIDATTVLS